MQSYLLGISPYTSSTSEIRVFLGLWSSRIGCGRRIKGPVCSSIEGARDHYSVLGIARNASLVDIKRAYRLLARKYHPDVSKDLKAGEVFKSIRVAYEALSNDAARAQYDRELEFQETMDGPYGRNWTYDPEQEYRKRIYKWAELRYRMQNKRHKARRYYDQSDQYGKASDHQRGPFSDVLLSASLTLFFTQILGPRLALAMNVFTSLFDTHLDAGYKMGFAVALFLGGRGGVLLTLCISFASWACGKSSSGLVALLVLAMWVGVNVSRFVPLPQGAILAMLYMSMKLKAQPR